MVGAPERGPGRLGFKTGSGEQLNVFPALCRDPDNGERILGFIPSTYSHAGWTGS